MNSLYGTKPNHVTFSPLHNAHFVALEHSYCHIDSFHTFWAEYRILLKMWVLVGSTEKTRSLPSSILHPKVGPKPHDVTFMSTHHLTLNTGITTLQHLPITQDLSMVLLWLNMWDSTNSSDFTALHHHRECSSHHIRAFSLSHGLSSDILSRIYSLSTCNATKNGEKQAPLTYQYVALHYLIFNVCHTFRVLQW